MNVRLPDGTVIANVPDGMSKADLDAKLARNGYDMSKLAAPAPQAPAAAPEPDSAWSRFGTGLMDPVVGAGQIMEKTGVPGLLRKGLSKVAPDIWSDTTMDEAVKQREQGYHAPEGVDWARIGGNVANPVNFVAPEAGLALKAIGPVGRAVAAGAAQSALAPVDPEKDFWTEKAKQAAVGGVASGVAAKVIPKVLGGMRAIDPTEAAKRLQAKGVTLTPGQAAGGMLNKAEQGAMSIPVVGDMIGSARTRALRDVQTAATIRAGIPAKAAANLDDAQRAVSEMYQGVVPKLKPTGEATVDVLGAVAKAADNPELTAANRSILEGIHDKLFGAEGERYMQLSGDQLKRLDAELGALGRKYDKSVLPTDKTLGEEIGNIQQAMRNAWKYHLDPADAAKLDAANRAHRDLIPLHEASSQRADALAMPRAIQKAMAKMENKNVSRAQADELIDDAVKVLSSTNPDSGTAGRLALPAAVGAVMVDPVSTAAAVAGTAAAYSRTGSNILTGNTAIQKAMSRTLEKASPQARQAFSAALRAHQSKQVNQEEQ